MELSRILIRELNDGQIIELREVDGHRSFPIVVGLPEAMAIERRLAGMTPPRPMSHDLMKSIMRTFGGRLDRVLVHELARTVGHVDIAHVEQRLHELDVDRIFRIEVLHRVLEHGRLVAGEVDLRQLGDAHAARSLLLESASAARAFQVLEIDEGLAEAIKMGLIRRASLFDLMEANVDAIRSLDKALEVFDNMRRGVAGPAAAG